MTKKAPKDSEPTFASARARIDAILEELEGDASDVDQLAARIKEASQLIHFCRERLAAARKEVRAVVAELTTDEADAVAAEPDAEPDPDPPADDGRAASGPGDLPF